MIGKRQSKERGEGQSGRGRENKEEEKDKEIAEKITWTCNNGWKLQDKI